MRTKLEFLVQGIALAAAALMLVQPARGDTPAQPVQMRLETRGEFARLWFPWRRNVDYEVTRRGNALSISFAHAARIEGTAAVEASDLILAAAPRRADGRAILTLSLAPAARVRHFRKDLDIIVDIMPPLAPPGPAGLALATEVGEPRATVR